MTMTYQTITPDITEDDKLWALLSYILNPIIPIIVLLMEDKKNRLFIRYHAIQALALAVVFFISCIILIGVCLSPLVLIYSIYLAVKAYQGDYIVIPILTDFVKNQGWLK
jgi:uncharacterized membrane protein